jgi:tetratricopeptide (TPR) repeat protein
MIKATHQQQHLLASSLSTPIRLLQRNKLKTMIQSKCVSLMIFLGTILPQIASFLVVPNQYRNVNFFRHSFAASSKTKESQTDIEVVDQLKELARRTSRDSTAILQAAQIQQQFQTESSSSTPEIINLFLEIYAYSCDSSAAQQAQDLLEIQREPEVNSVALVMEGWIRQGNIEQVVALYEKYATDDNELLLFHKVLKAYGRAGQAARAYELLQERVAQDKTVDQKAWIHVLRAHRSEPATIEKMMGEMMTGFRRKELEDWLPTIEAYNVLLLAYRDYAGEAEKLLYELVAQSKEGNGVVRPNAESFYHLLQAFGRQRQPSAFKVENVLQLQKALGVECTPQCLQTAIYVISKSRDHNKAQKAKKYLEQLAEEDVNSNVYSNVLAACAYTSEAAKPEDKLAAFEIAFEIFQKLTKGSEVENSSRPFALMLRCCEKLMKNPKKRDVVVRSVFQTCCDAGVVSDKVLKALAKAASESLQLQLLNGFVEDGFEVPSEWNRNSINSQ